MCVSTIRQFDEHDKEIGRVKRQNMNFYDPFGRVGPRKWRTCQRNKESHKWNTFLTSSDNSILHLRVLRQGVANAELKNTQTVRHILCMLHSMREPRTLHCGVSKPLGEGDTLTKVEFAILCEFPMNGLGQIG